jgi:hypothetical protein
MKGIIIVSKQHVDNCPGLKESLSALCDGVKSKGGHVMFYSREGTLMPLICTLLDREVPYTLELEHQAISK